MARGEAGPAVKVRLYTDARAWALPSACGATLAAHALLRFVGLQYAVVSGVSAALTQKGVLPVTVFDEGEEELVGAGIDEIVDLMEREKRLPSPYAKMTKFMKAEARAFMALLHKDFEPARVFEFWVDEANYESLGTTLRNAPESSKAFPMNRIGMYMKRRRILRDVAPANRQAIYAKAERALAALSTRLGDRNKFFYGENPTALDAEVFGELGVVLYAPLPNARLRTLIAAHPNLVGFCERIQDKYFGADDDYDFLLDSEAINGEIRKLAEAEAKAKAKANHDAGDASGAGGKSEQDAERSRKNRLFLYACAAIFGAFILLGNDTEFEPLTADQ